MSERAVQRGPATSTPTRVKHVLKVMPVYDPDHVTCVICVWGGGGG